MTPENLPVLPPLRRNDSGIYQWAEREMQDMLDKTNLLDMFEFVAPLRIRLITDSNVVMQFIPEEYASIEAGTYVFIHGEIVYKETFAEALIDFVYSFMMKDYEN